ncbi:MULTISPECIES: GGDEF domain-containing protein [unclassified Pseudoalteromonas]|uniref:EAL domain-containing protein n=1 Tax=unclassified Pseudoalteromonas TaxID=194690 RepID=UPI000C8FA2FF|nr:MULTISPECIES: GGDEF domain-containing protein [unclassified Pseudoalteromonas]QLE09010.1 GGDEF domain-containing protein [Pseudoalteromonas shioyasakiensis]MAD04670.1 diguanylate phosphodiesterase [Pseudoalteromonas sp.]MCG9710609.1 GGDEF domain-containing protein [Pseudoalteromonas sp. Isolate3]MCP4585827.1 GGDEF domain-containing protein [Pseudoalteromonas sp.]QWV05583.1 GGDEF domain-containing protein [Pseudoalteromonas shioyasakiensis]|tara:strand:- start:3732 stop:5675 length:1944 start_codon:yes stop_codon:yes gene_type:complete
MAGFKKLIFIQLISWLLFALLGGYFIALSFDSAVSDAQQKAQNVVSAYINTQTLDELAPEKIKHALADGSTFSKFVIRDQAGQVVSSVESSQPLPIFAEIVNATFNSIRPQFAVNQASDIKVEFTINAHNLASLLQQALFVVILISGLIALLPIIYMKSMFRRLNRKISTTVADIVDIYINQNQIDDDLEQSIDTTSLKKLSKDLIPSFNRLSHFLQTKHDDIQNNALNIKKEAYKDVVTNLGNRNMFVEYYEKNIENAEKSTFGSLAMVRCSELQAINQTRGYQKGDDYVKSVADIIKHISGTYTGSQVFRLNSSDFAVVLPNTPLKEAERFGDNLQSRFTQYQQNQELSSVANTGIVGYEKGKPLGELLSIVDNAMSMAQSKQANAWHVQRETDLVNNASAGFGNQNWRKVINEVIETKRVHLVMQNIMPIGKSVKAYAEIQVRFKTAENQMLPTASFLAMTEKLEMAMEIDRLIIDTSLEKIKTRNFSEKFFGINVTASSAHNDQFVIWLERRLLKDSNIASKLIFEVSEFGLQQNIKASKRFIDMVHRVGARITVERFGVGLTSFKFFRDLKPDFIKMDASYTRGLEEDKNNQYFMRLMVDLAHRIGVSVFAEGVESQEEKHIIETLCLDGVQGYYIEKPKDI